MSIKKQSAADDLKTWTLLAAFTGFIFVYIVGSLFAWGEGMGDIEKTNPARAAVRDMIIVSPLLYFLSGILFGLNGRLYKIRFITPQRRLIFYILLPILFGLSIFIYKRIWTG